MRWTSAFILAAVASLSAAHAGPNGPEAHIPKLFGGRRFMEKMKWKKALEEVRSSHAEEEAIANVEERGKLDGRANTSGKCGPTKGSCAAGYCCSSEGWCGLGSDYCTAPDCLISYGPGCDGNQKPDGVDITATLDRTKVGSIPYGGVGIYDCVNEGDIAITFDDGPYNFTGDLLDKLKKYNARATFMITGNNIGKGQINDPTLPWKAIIQRMVAEGHQIASHTWSHENYSAITTAEFHNQIYYNEIALNDILGYVPRYMRPPFSICPASCETQLAAMGYHITYFDLDTEGYLNDDPTLIQNSKDIWDQAIKPANPCTDNFLNIEHDIHYQTVYNLTDYMLASLFAHGFRSVTLGQCLGDPPENWYRAGSSPVPSYTFGTQTPTGTYSCLQTGKATTTVKTTPIIKTTPTATPTSTAKLSVDGSCGNGVTCKGSDFGNCCSANGWCGASVDYCDDGCQPDFGTCSTPDSPIGGVQATTEAASLPTGPGPLVSLPPPTPTAKTPAPATGTPTTAV